MAREKSDILTDKQTKIVDNLMKGMTEVAAIKAAGGNTNNAKEARAQVVQASLKQAQATIRDATTLSRLDIIDGILESIQMARTMSEPSTMINGFDKLAKIIGAYEPQKVKLELSEDGARLLKKMEAMTREELVMLSNGEAKVIDGEFVRVDH